MKYPIATLSLFFVLMVILISVLATAAPVIASERNSSISGDQAPPTPRVAVTPERVTITPRETPRISSGEVEVPITVQATPTPVIPQTTVTVPRTEPPTTPPVTQPTAVPVNVVTVLVYPSGNVYTPTYYYPPGYPYNIYSYYPTGTLTVTSNPSSAVVILDGTNSEITPWIYSGLTTGYHTVEVDYPGYQAYVQNVYVDNGASAVVNADLTTLGTYGSFFIQSTPPGADVYVDGNYQGTSPLTVSAMVAGPHQIELHRAGYEVLTRTEVVSAGQGNNLNYALTPYSSLSGSGSINIISTSPGALVYLDGTYKGAIQSGTNFNIISVSPGAHTLLLHLPGYADFTQTVQVYAGQISNVNATFTSPPPGQLSPPASSQDVGSIIVTSTPTGGQVSVDNQFRGIAPVTIYNVAPGTHIVNLKLAGYSDWSSSVDVQSNQMVTVPATFVPGSGTIPVSTRAGLSVVVIFIALATGSVILSVRLRK